MPKTKAKPASQLVEAQPSTYTHIALSRLRKSAKNVRSQAGDVMELASSIREHGLLSSLVVVAANGGYEVIAGSRRLAALEILCDEGHIPQDWPVPVLVAEGAGAVSKSLAENLERAELAPWDEAAAYEQMVRAGMTLDDIGAKIGRSSQYVRRRLALSSLGENMALLKAGSINLAQAVALAELPEKQQHQFLAAVTGTKDADVWRNNKLDFGPDTVGRWMAKDAFEVSDALFVPSIYESPEREARGIKGYIIQPLLGDQAGIEPYFSDKAEALELQRQAVEEIATELEKYWASVIYVPVERASYNWDWDAAGWVRDWGVKHANGVPVTGQPQKGHHLVITMSLATGQVEFIGGLRRKTDVRKDVESASQATATAAEPPITRKAWLEAQTAKTAAIQLAYARGDLRDVLLVVAIALCGGHNFSLHQGKFTIHPQIKETLESWAARLGLPPSGNPRNAPAVAYSNAVASTADLITNLTKLSEDELIQFVAHQAAACIGSKNIEYLEPGKTPRDIDALSARVDIDPAVMRSRIDRAWLNGLSFNRLGEIITEMIGQEPTDLTTKKSRVAFVLEHLANHPAYVPSELRMEASDGA